jgi:hypothetical protein
MKKLASMLMPLALVFIGNLPSWSAEFTIVDAPTLPGTGDTKALPQAGLGAGVANGGGSSTGTASSNPPAPYPPTVRTPADMAAAAVSINNAELVAIAGVSANTKVRVVMVSALDPDISALTKARSDKQADLDKRQAAVAANAAFKADLASHNIATTQIVGGGVTTDGSLTLYMLA